MPTSSNRYYQACTIPPFFKTSLSAWMFVY
jgi:hypothetical protein